MTDDKRGWSTRLIWREMIRDDAVQADTAEDDEIV